MNPFAYFRDEILALLHRLPDIPDGIDTGRVAVETPREASHGDVSTNAALVLAKQAGMKPRDLAEALAEGLRAHAEVARAEIAGPGFVNLWIADDFWRARLADALRAGPAYGESDIGGGEAVNVEYVSANPTGPMHVGHGRGAVIGDALAGLLAKTGYHVTREYYVNDAGAQVDILARSLHLRYREALGEEIGAFPDDFYPGDYLKPAAASLAARDGDKWLGAPEDTWLAPLRDFAVVAMMVLIRADLAALGIEHAVFTSERALAEAGAIDAAMAELEKAGLIYVGVLEPPKGKLVEDWEARPQTLFRSTDYGDDVDRPLRKSDGSWTYFAGDIAYHRDKIGRGFSTMIDVWGADHGGYVKRMRAAVEAIGGGAASLDVKLCQLVNLLEAGQPVRMSKRAGTFVSLREVTDRVGKDVVRFIMLTRKNDAALDFDLAKVVEQSRDNPVFYVQYAHARASSVLRHAAAEFPDADLGAEALAGADLGRLTDPAELALIKRIASWPRLVEAAAQAHEPHRVAFYLQELASSFHGLWTKGKEDAHLRFIHPEDAPLTMARLALVKGVAVATAAGLAVIGVAPREEM
ncbi:MAG: arginine--tRNA ligase [Alphaproteobacteria bacterium]